MFQIGFLYIGHYEQDMSHAPHAEDKERNNPAGRRPSDKVYGSQEMCMSEDSLKEIASLCPYSQYAPKLSNLSPRWSYT